MLFWNNDYSRGLAGHMRPVTSVVRPASAQCCWLCHLSSDGLEESERHRSQKIYRSSEENRSKWVLFRIAIYRSSGYDLIFCPAVSAELPGVLMFWNPTDARDHFTKKRASFQSELAFSSTTVCRKLASFSKKLASFLGCFTKLLAFCDPQNM